MVTLAGVVVLAVCTMSCRQKDIRTVTLNVPGMTNEAAAASIRKILAGTHGVYQRVGESATPVKTDLAAGTVTVTYDSMQTAIKNLEFAIATNGYATINVPVNAYRP